MPIDAKRRGDERSRILAPADRLMPRTRRHDRLPPPCTPSLFSQPGYAARSATARNPLATRTAAAYLQMRQRAPLRKHAGRLKAAREPGGFAKPLTAYAMTARAAGRRRRRAATPPMFIIFRALARGADALMPAAIAIIAAHGRRA